MLSRYSAYSITISFLYFFVIVSSSCVPARKAIFFNGLQPSKENIDLLAEESAKKIYPGDRVSINIVIEHPDGALLNSGMQSGANQGQFSGGSGYLVDKDGNIEIVKIGLIHVAGMTPSEVSEVVRKKVAVLYKDPFVSCSLSGRVLFLGLGTSAGIGAGGGGGVVPITNDRLTILEAFAIKGIGDPTAVRDRVWIIRESNGEREFATIDINSKDVFRSPYFYLRNNDIIYMEPNRVNTFLSVNGPTRLFISTVTSSLALLFSFLILLK